MNSRGFDIAITTIVLIVIGVAVLIGLIFFIKNGFSLFKSGTDPILQTQSLEATRQACELVCRSGNEFSFCCQPIKINEQSLYCTDQILDVDCNLNCATVTCPSLGN